jgi:ADP-ribose pyrophosphatase YjhB (NUDIX family)
MGDCPSVGVEQGTVDVKKNYEGHKEIIIDWMSNGDYNFLTTVGCKVVIRKEDNILMTREPSDHTWMPGRLGLPGGKVKLNESIDECVERKIADETGLKCNIKGLFKIINILMPEKNHWMFIYAADYVSGEIKEKDHYTDGLFWMGETEIKNLTKDDFTEYFYDTLFEEYFGNNKHVYNGLINIQRSYEDIKIREWMDKGTIRE